MKRKGNKTDGKKEKGKKYYLLEICNIGENRSRIIYAVVPSKWTSSMVGFCRPSEPLRFKNSG